MLGHAKEGSGGKDQMLLIEQGDKFACGMVKMFASWVMMRCESSVVSIHSGHKNRTQT
jgi:hypothetical protein